MGKGRTLGEEEALRRGEKWKRNEVKEPRQKMTYVITSAASEPGHALSPIDRLTPAAINEPFGPMVEENSPGGHGVDLSLLLALHGGQVLSTMAEPEHHRYRWQLRVREDLGGHGDRQVIKPALGGDSSDGRNL